MKKAMILLIEIIMISIVMVFPVRAGEWHNTSNGWWYEEQNSILQEDLNGGYYPANQWWSDGEKRYYFDADGYMLSDTITPDGYRVGADGALALGGTDEIPNKSMWNHFYELDAEAELINQKMDYAGSQYDMNMASLELYNFWDTELNALYGKLKEILSDEDFENLKISQRAWIGHKESTVAAEGDKFGEGTMRPMAINLAAAYETRMRIIWLLQNYIID